MNTQINKRAVGVGAFIIIGIFFLVAGVLIIGNLHSTFQKKMVITSLFEDVNGLQSGNNIWFSGVKIGTVKKLEFIGQSHVKVLMNINVESKQYIRKDAKVKVGTDGLIGNKILVIYGGSAATPEIEIGDTLINEVPLSSDDILETLQKNNLNLLSFTEKLARGQGTVSKLMNNDSIYKDILQTTHSLKLASQNAEILITSLSTFSNNLNTKGMFVKDIISDTVMYGSIKKSVLTMQHMSDSANAMVNKLNTASSNPKSSIGILLHDEETGTNLKASIANLKSSTANLDKDLEALQHSFLLRKFFKKKGDKK